MGNELLTITKIKMRVAHASKKVSLESLFVRGLLEWWNCMRKIAKRG